MNLRKLIKEQLERIFEEQSQNAIVGLDIINHFPFDKLPETRKQVDFNNRDVNGWGSVEIPSTDGNGLQTVFSKEEVFRYIEKFKSEFGEEPMFVLNPSAPWYGRITITNEPYIKRKELYNNAVNSLLEQKAINEQ
jgi:hypothetical protein